MCDLHNAPRGGPRFPVARLLVLGLVVAASVVIMIVAPGNHARAATQPRSLSAADHVFVRDLATTATEALAIADKSDSALAASERAAQRAWLARLSAIAPGAHPPQTPIDVRQLREISQQQVLIARIEDASGHDPALRSLAREVSRAERTHLKT